MQPKKSGLTKSGRKVTRRAKQIHQEKLDKKCKYKQDIERAKIGQADKRVIWLNSGRTCHLCGRRITSLENCQIDHIRPRTLGGKDKITNYLPICKRCNTLKKNSTPRQIRQAMRLGLWALQQIRDSTRVGIEIANSYNKDLE